MTQEELAHRAGVSVEAVGALEQGKRLKPHRETRDKLADALQLSGENRDRFYTAAASSRSTPRNRISSSDIAIGLSAPIGNLPYDLTTLIGRQQELSQLRELMNESRLVSLIGTPGVGKTRVAVQAASLSKGHERDGMWFIDLASVQEIAEVPSCFMLNLQVPGLVQQSATEAVLDYLKSRRALLVVDNCEHVLAAAARIIEMIVRACPAVSVLATSREPLRVEGERVVIVAPLPIPRAGGLQTIAEIRACDSVLLLEQRARAADAAFALSDEDVKDAGEIVELLDGIPLAIVLIAARVPAVGLHNVALRLKSRFRTDNREEEVDSGRHSTMHAAIDWSYRLLTEREGVLFRRLCVFASGWTLDAVEAVCADETLPPSVVAEVLASLVAKSLVLTESVTKGFRFRFRFLTQIRHFAAKRWAASGDRPDVVLRRFAEYSLDAAKITAQAFSSDKNQQDVSLIQRELPNHRAALEWALSARSDVRLGGEIVRALAPYLRIANPSEALRLARQGVGALGNTEPDVAAALWNDIAVMDDLPVDQRREAMERSITLSRIVNDPVTLHRGLNGMASILAWFYPAQRKLAATYSQQALEICADAETVAVQRVDRYPRGIITAMTLRIKAFTVEPKDFVLRRDLLSQALELVERLGATPYRCAIVTDLSEMAFEEGDIERARYEAREAIEIAKKSTSNYDMLVAICNEAHYAAADSDWRTAATRGRRLLRLALATQVRFYVTLGVQILAMVKSNAELLLEATRLLGFCDSRYGTVHIPLPDRSSAEKLHDRLTDALRRNLGQAEFDRIHSAGFLAVEDDVMASVLTRSKESRPK